MIHTILFSYFISLVHLKQSYNTKLKDQGYFIHTFSSLWKKEEVFLNKQYNNLQMQYIQSLFYEIQGGQDRNTLEFST